MAKKKPVKKCHRCGVVVKSYSYGYYCDSCAADVWDAGFESTTQHAEEIYEYDLKQKEKINKLLNEAQINHEKVSKLVEYRSGVFRCVECGKFRFRWEHFGEKRDEEKLREVLTAPCPKCNAIGKLKFE